MALLRLLERLIESIRICFNSFRAEDFSQFSKTWVLYISSYPSVPIARPLITQQRTESVVDEYQETGSRRRGRSGDGVVSLLLTLA